ncbi:MAG: hypothetical protein L6R39_002444 [Caloplaca ligustica]|nr:MAG: hypothetical protein L6R39_002444 [Caloplaca ligustica]
MNSRMLYLNLPKLSHRSPNALPAVTPSATVLVESPFFLQPANHTSDFASCGPKLSQIAEDLSEQLPTFPLTRLPVELQLRVLWHCLVSSLPILNAGIPKDAQVGLVENETHGQRRINPAIISTCKAYHHEGIKLLYPSNHFTYTFSNESKFGQVKAFKNFSLIENLVLRPICHEEMAVPKAAAKVAMHWLRHLKALRTLQIDFYGADIEHEYPDDDEDDDSLSLLFEFVDNMFVERMHTRGPTNGLSELILTGLPEDDVGLSILRAMSLLMRCGGRIGIAVGHQGRRYAGASKTQSCDQIIVPEAVPGGRALLQEMKPRLHWLRVEDVGGLIGRAASDPSSKWLFGDLGLVSKRCV